MPRGVLTAAIGLLLFVAPNVAGATILQQCCACVYRPDAMSSGIDPKTIPALFCAEANTSGIGELEERCDDQSGSLVCSVNIPGPSCTAQLAEEGYLCPSAGVPAAGPLTLVALASALSLLGAVVLRRRLATQRR